MVISARPSANASALFSHPKTSQRLNIEFYPLGRDALLASLIALGLKKGDGVIIPAYMCNSTLVPLESYGFRLIFVDVNHDLSLSLKSLQDAAAGASAKALLLVHYFGFLQIVKPISQVCESLGIKLIEDFSHSFLSHSAFDQQLLSTDAQIFSMRKSLPIVDGGALRLKHVEYDISKDHCAPCASLLTEWMYLFKRLVEKILTLLHVNIYANWISNNREKPSTEGNVALNTESCHPSWQLNQYLSDQDYLQHTQQRIKYNFKQLSTKLTALGIESLFAETNEREVPQALVVRDPQGGMVEYLRSHGVGAWRWPAEEMPETVAQQTERYPNANYYNKSLVLLPIHQSVSDRQIDYMAQVLSRWQS